ncbi:hypothetical protein VIGAN_01421100, partial [Vigna angularis var. angularis]
AEQNNNKRHKQYLILTSNYIIFHIINKIYLNYFLILYSSFHFNIVINIHLVCNFHFSCYIYLHIFFSIYVQEQ